MKILIWTLPLVASAALSLGAAEAKVDFVKDIQPILKARCVECHGPDKQKGKLRLDTKDAAFKSGKSAPVIVAGDASKSEFHRRISLPPGDDDIMPNEGDPLTKEQITLLRDWINQGANWPDGVTLASESAKPESAKKGPPGPVRPADFKPSPAELKAIEKLGQAGFDVRPIAMNTSWREANLRVHGSNVTDTAIAPLKDILGLVDLNLGATRVTDAGLAHLAGLTNLERLHLELTPVTDKGLAHLKKLGNLTYLNLYGTAVTDAGLDHLKGMSHLRSLYVWQTKVTEAGIENLKKSLPNVEVIAGLNLAPVVKAEEKKEEKKE